MTQTEITKGNKLIAEFMDYTISYYSNEFDMVDVNGKMKSLSSWAKYHSDWNWLMPVLEKICKMKIGDGITYVEYAYPTTFGMLREETGQIMIRLTGHQLFEATYLYVIDFIIHFNNDKNKG